MAIREPLAITVTDGGLAIVGDVDITTAPALRTAITAAVAVIDNPPVWLDMSGVSFMDSSGVSALVGAYRRTQGAIRVVSPSQRVARILELTGMYDRFVDVAS